MLGVLLAVCMFFERAIEVFLSAFRSGEADRLDHQIDRATQRYNSLVDPKRAVAANLADIERASKALDDAREMRVEYRIASRAVALWSGLCGGLLVSLAGFRMLRPLLDKASFDIVAHDHLFKAVDVLITGALIAGGSDAINRMSKLYGTFMDTVNKKTRGINGGANSGGSPTGTAAIPVPAAGAPPGGGDATGNSGAAADAPADSAAPGN
jgi:hypothetical protein